MHRVFPRSVRFAVLAALLTIANWRPARAQMLAPPVLNPATYKSPSGVYALTVDPSDLHGRYGGTYRLTKNAKEVWSATLPFTFQQAVVTDTGVAGGYAYSLGMDGFGKTRNEPSPGDIVVAIIGPRGQARLQQSTKRHDSRLLHAAPAPLGNGLIVDDANDRLIVRIANDDQKETWWTYGLSTGAVLEKLSPQQSLPNTAAWGLLDAKPVKGTPLILLHWWRFAIRHDATRFTLVDRLAKPVWTLDLPSDDLVGDDGKAQKKVPDWLAEHGGILRTDRPNQFEVFLGAESKRVTFTVKQQPSEQQPSKQQSSKEKPSKEKPSGEWTVTEVARIPYSIAPTEPLAKPPAKPPTGTTTPSTTAPTQSLKPRGTLVLQAKPAEPASIRDVRDFAFDGQGRIAFLREDDRHASRFILVDQRGQVIREIPLKIETVPDTSHWSGHGWVGGNRFVISLSEFGVDTKAKAWWVDVESGKVEAIADFDCPSIDRLIASSDGRFVALATENSKYTMEKSVIAFDARGRRQWSLKDDFNNKEPGALFSVADVALTTEGELVVLENIVHTVKVFDRDGHFRRAIDLQKAWGRKPNYLAGISSDVAGGYLIADFQGSPPFVRMSREGLVRKHFQPKYADGRMIGTVFRTQAAPDGRLWVCDGHSLMRLDEAGVVDRVLGESPQSNHLGKIAGIFVDPRGRLYAVDSRTGSVYVFDASGKLVHVCQAKPTDFSEEIWSPSLTTDEKGDVYLGLGANWISDHKRPYAHFSADGTRLGTAILPTRDCYFQPGSGILVAKRYEEVRLIDPSGKTVRTIDRRPDHNWLASPESIALAPDGSLAIVAGHSLEATVNIYKPNGDPVRTIPLPESAASFPRIAYDGKRLVVAGDEVFLIFDTEGRLLVRCDPPLKVAKGMYYYPYILPGGRELALFDGREPVLHRYQMP